MKLSTCKKWIKKIISCPKPVTRSINNDQDGKCIKDWRHLSPDQPPLPSLLSTPPITTTKTNTVESRPLSSLSSSSTTTGFSFLSRRLNKKDHQQQQLDPILEETESSTISNTMNNHPSNKKMASLDDQLSIDSSTTSQPRNSSSSFHQSIPPATSRPLSPSSSSHQNLNELECKKRFSKMVQSTFHFQYKRFTPTTMKVHFQDNRVYSIHVVLSNGQEKDFLFTGNSQYIPPEMYSRATYSRGLSDVWVLGVSLYKMLVGTYPFKANDDVKLWKKMLSSDFSIPDHLSEDVKDLLRRMLAPEQTRASLDLVMFHPWLKPYHVNISTPSSLSSKSSKPSTASFKIKIQKFKSKKKSSSSLSSSVSSKWYSMIHWILQWLCYGPYPPPSKVYNELAHFSKSL
ncbi:hypothetical protein BJ944DRAFT_273991 [Cunninghamella echinulata]|nr:hypothetical protein BJ944DRAFT_273991 [Cunninghamella echinulata]